MKVVPLPLYGEQNHLRYCYIGISKVFYRSDLMGKKGLPLADLTIFPIEAYESARNRNNNSI